MVMMMNRLESFQTGVVVWLTVNILLGTRWTL